MKIFEKFLVNTENVEAIEKVSVILIFMFEVIYVLLHMFFFIFFLTQGVPEMSLMNLTCIIVGLLSMHFLLDVKTVIIGGYIVVINFGIYTIGSAYLLGYGKHVTVLYPLMLLILHTLFPKKRSYLIWSTLIILLFYCINIYMRYHVVSIYENSLGYVEYINYGYAFGSVALFLYVKSLAEKVVVDYKAQLDKVASEANYDFLTGLYNRRFLEQRFLVEDFDIAYIVIVDIDFFKKVNDTYGHLCGDYVLKEVSQLLRNTFRPVDDVCRWGGEEFMVYIRNAKELDVEKKLNKTRELIESKLFEYHDESFNITASFGYSQIIHNENYSVENINEYVEMADNALYYAKQTGRNKVVRYSDIENFEI